MTDLTVPTIDEASDPIAAALAYAAAGWYVGPVRAQLKHPGSILGTGWTHKTTRDPKVIASWFAGTNYGVFLHAGRSGALIFDVDHPDFLPDVLGKAFASSPPPMQTTRDGDPRRGHYLYLQPPDRVIGNGAGTLGAAWGDVRGRNGVIIVAPSIHAKAAEGGRYTWQQTGVVPVLPIELALNLPDAATTDEGPATDKEVRTFLDQHVGQDRESLFLAVTKAFDTALGAGGSRHNATVEAACWAMREARAGCYPARQASEQLQQRFAAAINGERDAGTEYAGILAFAIAQANTTDAANVRQAVEQRAPKQTDPFGSGVSLPKPQGTTITSPVDIVKVTKEHHRGHTRMAYRLAAEYSEKLMFVFGVGWHIYDGKRWVEDQRSESRQAVIKVLKEALGSALGNSELVSDVRKCESSAGNRGVLDIASALPAFAMTVADLDADPYLLNVANGTLDLRTLELRPHDPKDRLTKVTRGAYRTTVDSQAWDQFLTRVLPEQDVREFLQRLAGVGLVGRVLEHVLGILTGTGRNGKGVFYGALGHALGDYYLFAEPDLFMQRQGASTTGEMDLRGVRWAVVSENDQGRHLAEATMKRLTGGDPITARHLYQKHVTFLPSHTPILVTNHLPKVSGDDPAIWARIRVVPFDVVIPAPERDTHLPERLELHADAILSWAITGYQDYSQRGRLDEPASVEAATNAYQRDNDAVARFVEENCHIASIHCTRFAAITERFTSWARQDGTSDMSPKTLGAALDRLGYKSRRGSQGVRLRDGITLKTEESDSEE